MNENNDLNNLVPGYNSKAVETKPGKVIIEGEVAGEPQSSDSLSPVQLERIGRNLDNTTRLYHWMSTHLDEIFNANPKSNYALATLEGDFDDGKIKVHYFRKKYTNNFGFGHRIKSALKPEKVDKAMSGLERLIDIVYPGREEGAFDFLKRFLGTSKDQEVSFHLEYKYQNELVLML